MGDKNHTRKLQVKFIQALREGDQTLPQILAGANIPRGRLSKWMISPYFRRAVHVVLRRLKAIHTLEGTLVRCVAQSNVSRMVGTDPKTPEQQERCVALAGDKKSARRRKTKKQKKQIEDSPREEISGAEMDQIIQCLGQHD